MGFCYFNNVGIAARYLQTRHGIERVAIIDWDVHHGNGTQHSFEEDPSIFFFSIHQFPHYPGTGARGERGGGAGSGYTLNAPMPAGSGDSEYLQVFREELRPAMESFEPDFILISAGFDAHRADPLGAIQLTERGFETLTREVLSMAEDYCGGKVVSALEGGYDLEATAGSAAAPSGCAQECGQPLTPGEARPEEVFRRAYSGCGHRPCIRVISSPPSRTRPDAHIPVA